MIRRALLILLLAGCYNTVDRPDDMSSADGTSPKESASSSSGSSGGASSSASSGGPTDGGTTGDGGTSAAKCAPLPKTYGTLKGTLCVPSNMPTTPAGLVVAMHGYTQGVESSNGWGFKPTSQWEVLAEKHKVLMILVNLISNAKYAVESLPEQERRVSVSLGAPEEGRIQIEVKDNGMGIAPDMLTRIFQYGFTTRHEGHGFGLHSSALAAQEMGGSLSAHSDGLGKGALFTLVLPIQPELQSEQVHG